MADTVKSENSPDKTGIHGTIAALNAGVLPM
jgi:hypothetical protein